MAEHRSEPVTPQAAAEIAQVDERVRARRREALIRIAVGLGLVVVAVFSLLALQSSGRAESKATSATIVATTNGQKVSENKQLLEETRNLLQAQKDQFNRCKNKPASTPGCASAIAPEIQTLPKPADPVLIPGPVGRTGAQGIQGLPGPQGPQGIQGLPGPVGPTGAMGVRGAGGEVGATGPAGANGTDGSDGQDGQNPPCLSEESQCQGKNGLNGTDGKNGQDGSNGTDGKDGSPGENGPNVIKTEFVDVDPDLVVVQCVFRTTYDKDISEGKNFSDAPTADSMCP